ncbi:MAG: c-type cytochrome, partial [Azonexus sp.]
MKQRWSMGVLAAGALSLSATAFAAAPTPEMISFSCAGCHGTNGGSAGLTMPSLASQSKTAIVDAMKKFKSGERPSTVMGRLAKGYSDADIEKMAEFFSKQKF